MYFEEQKTKIKEEQKRIIGILPVMDMKHFVLLLLADLASKSPIVYFDGSNTKTAVLHTEYKRIIEDIMYQENGWGIEFAELINIHSYYEFQADWEDKLGKTIHKVINDLNKNFKYDFEHDSIEIDFTQEEIDRIKSSYDEETLQVMSHFSNLINAPCFSRRLDLVSKESNRSINRSLYNCYAERIRTYRRNGITDPEKYIEEFKPL